MGEDLIARESDGGCGGVDGDLFRLFEIEWRLRGLQLGTVFVFVTWMIDLMIYTVNEATLATTHQGNGAR